MKLKIIIVVSFIIWKLRFSLYENNLIVGPKADLEVFELQSALGAGAGKGIGEGLLVGASKYKADRLCGGEAEVVKALGRKVWEYHEEL